MLFQGKRVLTFIIYRTLAQMCIDFLGLIMKFTWCGLLHKWNEHWPAWLPIDNEIILRYRSVWRYCQRKLDMMSVLFYKLTILALTLTLIYFYSLEKENGETVPYFILSLPQKGWFHNAIG